MTFLSLKISKKLFFTLFSALITGIAFLGQSFVIENPEESDLATQLLALIDAENTSDFSEEVLANIATTIFSEVENIPSSDPAAILSEEDFSTGKLCFTNTLRPFQIEQRMPPAIKEAIKAFKGMITSTSPGTNTDAIQDVINLCYIAYGSYFVQVQHGGCAEFPWRDNQPQCYWAVIAPNFDIKTPKLQNQLHSLATYGMGAGVDIGTACYYPAGSVLNWSYSVEALAEAATIIADAVVEVGCGIGAGLITGLSAGALSAATVAIEVGCNALSGLIGAGIESGVSSSNDAWGVWVEEVDPTFFNTLGNGTSFPPAIMPIKKYKNTKTMFRKHADDNFSAEFLVPGNIGTYLPSDKLQYLKDNSDASEVVKATWTGGFGSQWVER